MKQLVPEISKLRVLCDLGRDLRATRATTARARPLLSFEQMRPRPHAILGKAPCGHMQRKLSDYHQTRTRKFCKEMSTRSYQDAVDHLNSLQSNAETLKAIRASGGRNGLAIPEMVEFLERIGYIVSDCRCSATSDLILSAPTSKRA
jgi:hypothetical protein